MTCQNLKEIEFCLRLNFNDSDAKMEVNSKIHQSRKTRFVVNAVVRAASAPGLSKKEKTKRSILGPCTVTATRAAIRQVWICIRSGVSQLIKLPLRSKKAGRFKKLLGFARSHSIVTCSSVSISCATTPHPSCFSKS